MKCYAVSFSVFLSPQSFYFLWVYLNSLSACLLQGSHDFPPFSITLFFFTLLYSSA